MTLRCKVGDLAIVVGPCETPGLEGRVVEVVRPYAGEMIEGYRWSIPSFPWVCKSARPLPVKRIHEECLDSLIERPILDLQLRPISGVPVDEGVSDEVPA